MNNYCVFFQLNNPILFLIISNGYPSIYDCIYCHKYIALVIISYELRIKPYNKTMTC